MNSQIDALARRRLCGLMRQFANGSITNDEFDRAFENIDASDRAANPIAVDAFAYY